MPSVCQVANVRKETKFNWFKDEEEIALDAAPNVMSGTVSLPIPMVTITLSRHHFITL